MLKYKSAILDIDINKTVEVSNIDGNSDKMSLLKYENYAILDVDINKTVEISNL